MSQETQHHSQSPQWQEAQPTDMMDTARKVSLTCNSLYTESTIPTHLVCDHSWHLSQCRALWLEWTLLQHTVHGCWTGPGLGNTLPASTNKNLPAIPECWLINSHRSGRTSSHENIMGNKNGHKSHRTAPWPSSQWNLITITQHNIQFSPHQWDMVTGNLQNSKPQHKNYRAVINFLWYRMPQYHNISARVKILDMKVQKSKQASAMHNLIFDKHATIYAATFNDTMITSYIVSLILALFQIVLIVNIFNSLRYF